MINLMKSLLITSAVLFSFLASARADEIVVKGTYQGENIYVRNPFAVSGVGFCVYEVTVNGAMTSDEINSSAFEVDLSVYGFAVGDEVSVTLKYKDDCTPMVLNADALQVKTPANFETVSVKAEEEKLVFTTSNETGSIPFIIEQYRWNKWIKVGEVRGKGHNRPNSYEVPIRLHSGVNKFRVRQTNNKKISVYSREAVAITQTPAITFSKSDNSINFSDATMYEVYDQFGGIVFKGYGQSANISGLAAGKYSLNYDNVQSEFVKK